VRPDPGAGPVLRGGGRGQPRADRHHPLPRGPRPGRAPRTPQGPRRGAGAAARRGSGRFVGMDERGRGGAVAEDGSTSGTPAVEVRGLRKTYGSLAAVDGVDLTVEPGETFGFLGPNGAGKSTTIKILCTLVAPTSGEARVAGYDVVRERAEVRRHIGLVFQDTTLDTYLSAELNLRFHAELYGIPRDAVEPRMRQVLEM